MCRLKAAIRRGRATSPCKRGLPRLIKESHTMRTPHTASIRIPLLRRAAVGQPELPVSHASRSEYPAGNLYLLVWNEEDAGSPIFVAQVVDQAGSVLATSLPLSLKLQSLEKRVDNGLVVGPAK